MIETLIKQLELATQESASGKKGWDEFGKFMTNFETLAELHDPEDTDVIELIKSKQICYHIASDKVDRDPKMAVKFLSRVEKLIQSKIFPRETKFATIVGWLEQVTFLFDSIWPEKIAPDSSSISLFEQALNLTKALVVYCSKCLTNSNDTTQDATNCLAFEKVCRMIKCGVSQNSGAKTFLNAVYLLKQLASLMKQAQFVATIGQQQFELISGKLWSIVKLDLRSITAYAIRGPHCFYSSDSESQMRRTLSEEISAAIMMLPSNDEVLAFFYGILKKRLDKDGNASDLALLNHILKARNYEAKGILPILDIHMGRGGQITEIPCLYIAKGLFARGNHNLEEFQAILKHIELIIDNTRQDRYVDCQLILGKVSELLCSISRNDDSTRNEIQLYLIRLLKDTPVNLFSEKIVAPLINAISTNQAFPLDAKLFRGVAISRFRLIYQSGVLTKQHIAALKALYLLIETEGDHQTSHKRKCIETVAAGCQGTAPIGCNKAMFEVLKETRALVGDDREMCLLPLARAVFDHRDSSVESDYDADRYQSPKRRTNSWDEDSDSS